MVRYSTSFVLTRKSKDDPIRRLACRVRWDGGKNVVSINVGYQINPDKWSTEMEMCKLNSYHGKRKTPGSFINREIDRWRTAVDKTFEPYVESCTTPSADTFRRELRKRLGLPVKDATDTSTTFGRFLSEGEALNAWSPGTVKTLKVLGRMLDDCGIFSGFDTYTTTRLTRFVTWMREERDNCDVSIAKKVGYLRWFLSWAQKAGYKVPDDYKTFKPKTRPSTKPVIFLEWDELMKVWDYAPPTDHLREVRDMFLFSAFTSLRYSDVVNLRWSDIGKDSLRVTTIKTNDALIIDLNKWSKEILSRHKGGGDSPVFRRIHNQVCNRYLKQICKECGIDSPVRLTTWHGSRRDDVVKKKYELVGTHCGRRTFICNALMMGISPTIVMQWTGHSGYDAMKPYIAIANEARKKAMTAFDKR